MSISKLTKEELLDKFEAIICQLEKERDANTEKDYVVYWVAISNAREKLEQLKRGLY